MENIENFIRVYDNVVSQKYCEDLIDYFNWCEKVAFVYNRDNNEKLVRSDISTNLDPLMSTLNVNKFFTFPNNGDRVVEFNKGFEKVYTEYLNEFPYLKDIGEHAVFTYKLQKTLPSNGYHLWHFEKTARGFDNRISTFILYLNTFKPEDAGETEFLYQQLRVSPKAGTLVIWPASYTHVHRGNPPIGKTKYIMTGWTEYY